MKSKKNILLIFMIIQLSVTGGRKVGFDKQEDIVGNFLVQNLS
jgi:hypothetical protein